MKENIKNKNIELSEDKNIEFLEDKKMELSEENNNIFSEEKRQIQALLDKYLAGETSNEEEELLRNYFEEHGNDIPEEWKPFRAMFSFVGFEKLKFLAEEDSRDVSAEEDSRDVSAEEAIIEEFRKESDNEDNNESDKKSDNNSNEGSDNNSNEGSDNDSNKGSDNDSNKGSDKPQKAKQRSLLRYISISAAAAIALILTITGIRSISNPSWGDTQPECYAVIDGKVYTNPEKVHDEALDALQGIGEEGQDDAFEALDMMQ